MYNNIERIGNYDCIKPQYLYELMCGTYSDVKPTLVEMRRVLTGPHHNALAWHTALAVCAPEDPTLVGSWMQMLGTFSSLAFYPTNPEAWQFWHLLHECVKDDASGQELLSCLAETKHEMASAFTDAWTIVDALYQGSARYTEASRIYLNYAIDIPAVVLEEIQV